MRYVPRLIPYLKPYWRLVIVSVLLTFAVTLLGLALPWPMQVLLDNVLAAKAPSSMLNFLPDFILNDRENLLWFAILSGFILALLHELAAVISNFVSTKIEQRMALDLRGDLFSHAQKMSLAFHDQRRSGSLIYAVNFQASSAVGILMAVPPMLQSLLTLLGMFVILTTIDFYLGLLSLAVVPFLYLYISYYAGNVQSRIRDVKRMEARSLSIIHEAVSMFRVISAFGRETHEFHRFRSQGEQAVDARVKVTLRQTLFTLAVNATIAAGTALVLGFGAMRALNGSISPGQMIVAVSYLAAVYKPLERLSYTIGGLQERFVSTQMAFGLRDTEPDIKDRPGAVHLERAHGGVIYDHVSFSYRQREKTLRDISFEVPAGSFVGVIGPTGAGKTTLMSLLPRFYDPKEGRILLDGMDIRDLTITSLRHQVSIVLQDPLLFRGTIAENIRYGRLDANESEIIEAAKAANADEFIMNLKQQYDTQVGERGVQLSGGERQRVCIARAFLKDAPILILDEPTSAVDTRTEADILEAMNRLMVGRTTVMIAHRLWALRRADLILVVDKGQIVEQGTHAELLRQGGLYSQLHGMQNGRPEGDALIASASKSEFACPKCGSPMFLWQQSPPTESYLCHHCMARLELPATLSPSVRNESNSGVPGSGIRRSGSRLE